jgi:hypothetical protein
VGGGPHLAEGDLERPLDLALAGMKSKLLAEP